jgi:hypothetical protein
MRISKRDRSKRLLLFMASKLRFRKRSLSHRGIYLVNSLRSISLRGLLKRSYSYGRLLRWTKNLKLMKL